MDILEFVQFAQRHRLSVKNFSFPYDEKDWHSLFFESLWRNNTVLLNDLYSKCPQEYKENTSNYILNIVFGDFNCSSKPYSQKILKWVFNNIPFEHEKRLSALNISEEKREDLVDYLASNNKNHQFDNLLINTIHFIAYSGDLDFFKKTIEKVDWHVIDSRMSESSKLSNPFMKILNNSFDKKTLEYILPKIGDNKDVFSELIKKCSTTLSNIEQIQNHAEMLDMVFSHMKDNIPSLYKDIQSELNQEHSKFLYKNIFHTSVYHAKVLEKHDCLTNFILYRCVETLGMGRNADIAHDSLEFLYNNFNREQIDNAFDDKHKWEMFANLIFRNRLTEADYLLKHNPYILTKEIKNNISQSLLGSDNDSKIKWAKIYLTIEDIDELIAKPGNKKHFEELTTWKCENFLYTPKDNRVEKKKIKI
jgi:hypothetical protein